MCRFICTSPKDNIKIRKLEKQMQEASKMLEFEYAAILRDRIIELRKESEQ